MDLFTQFGLIILIAAGVSVLMRLLKQPLIIGYIITGVIIGPYALNFFHATDTAELFSKIGITSLLFIVGLGLSPKVVKEMGFSSLLGGALQILITTLAGFFIGIFFKYSIIESLYISIALTLSSTIIILKLLTDKNDINKLYGRLTIGFLLVQDFFAIVVIAVITSSDSSLTSFGLLINLLITFFKGFVLLLTLVFLSHYVLPKFSNFLAKSQEMLFIFSLAWGLGIGVIYQKLGLSIEIGALVAGVSLSMTPYSHEISSRLRPLRDFFIIIFFIFLGHQIVFTDYQKLFTPIVIFSLFVIIGNPLILFLIVNLLGYSKKTGFKSGVSMAQISEFSLILVTLGTKVGHISKEILSLVTFIGIITITVSTYLIQYSEELYNTMYKIISLFEFRKIKRDRKISLASFDAILFGYHRVGKEFTEMFNILGLSFLVVDFNPDSIKMAEKNGCSVKYGDISDVDFLEELDLMNVRICVSTVPDVESNILLATKLREVNRNAFLITLSNNIEEALKLYENGATYVIMPHYIGAKFASTMIEKKQLDADLMEKEREKHIEYLKNRVSEHFV